MSKTDYFHHGIRKDHKVTALLDGDIVAVRSAAIFEAKDGFEEDHLYALVRKTVRDWVAGCGADDFAVCMSKGRSFRYEAYPAYKSNRKAPKPRGTDEAKQYLRDVYPIYEHDTLEADDVMGILATEPQDKEVRIIVSTDKDMLQIPAWQYNPDKDRCPWRPTAVQAWPMLVYQWLCGDSGDGYPGISGFGDAKFHKWLIEATEPTMADISALFDHYGCPEMETSQFVCAKILQWEDRPDNFLQIPDSSDSDIPF